MKIHECKLIWRRHANQMIAYDLDVNVNTVDNSKNVISPSKTTLVNNVNNGNINSVSENSPGQEIVKSPGGVVQNTPPRREVHPEVSSVVASPPVEVSRAVETPSRPKRHRAPPERLRY